MYTKPAIAVFNDAGVYLGTYYRTECLGFFRVFSRIGETTVVENEEEVFAFISES